MPPILRCTVFEAVLAACCGASLDSGGSSSAAVAVVMRAASIAAAQHPILGPAAELVIAGVRP